MEEKQRMEVSLLQKVPGCFLYGIHMRSEKLKISEWGWKYFGRTTCVKYTAVSILLTAYYSLRGIIIGQGMKQLSNRLRIWRGQT